MGKTPSRNNSEYWNTEDYKWISIADLGKTGKYISETKEYLSESAVTDSGIKVIPANTVVMSFKLSIGKTAITAEDMYSNEAIMAFHDRHVIDILPEYIYYMFKYKNWDEGSNKAVMGKTLNKATLSEVEIDIHSVEEQRKIVNVLDKMMAVLAGREAELVLLDDLIKARFVEMFGDLASNPCGWDTFTMEECFDITSSKRILKSEWKSQGIPFLRVRDMVQLATTGQMDNEYFVSEEFYESLSDSDGVPRKGDILVSATSTLGKCHVVGEGERYYFKDADVLRFRAKKEINPIFFMELMKTYYVEDQISKTLGITTVAHFTIKAAKTINMRCPAIELQDEFADFVKQVHKSKFQKNNAIILSYNINVFETRRRFICKPTLII